MTAAKPTPTRFRETVRALILAPDPAVLLIHMVFPDRDIWCTPGGGVAPGESHQAALLRELHEEVGRADFDIGPHIWVREGTFNWRGESIAEREYFYLVRTDRFVADSSGNPVAHEREAMAELKWWAVSDLPKRSRLFAPMRLGMLVADLLRDGTPPRPINTGF